MPASLYRQYAAECLQILATTKHAKNSAALRVMAIAWTDLAELAEGAWLRPQDSKNARPRLAKDRRPFAPASRGYASSASCSSRRASFS